MSKLQIVTRIHYRITIVAMLFVMAVATQAQVTLTIPTDDIFTAINEWIVSLAPTLVVVIGIPVSLVILNYVGVMIMKAFNIKHKEF